MDTEYTGKGRRVFVRVGIVIGIFLTASVCAPLAFSQTVDPADDNYFGSVIQPILASQCFECHGPDEATRQADLRLDTSQGVFGKTGDGQPIVKPGDHDASALLRRIVARDDLKMPPEDSGKSLTEDHIEAIKRWIANGAIWKQHWSLVAPQRPRLPKLASTSDHANNGPINNGSINDWPLNAIDYFTLAAMREKGFHPSPLADKRSLIRRVTIDLTGLPPTPHEVDAFLSDDSPTAYEKLVDRLLSSPRYGERMAVPWLDAARYADTHGYLFDTERSMWRWRDWVIRAFNQNQPFDQFTIEQLAGDLLPNPTTSQQIATGFNRNHLINNEAGAIPAEYLVENVIDRVNTTATVWMGLSLACCQCHDHKYDPFTQREYYQLYAFFNTIPELGLDGLNTNAKPLIKAPTALDDQDLADLRQRASHAERQMKSLSSLIDAGQKQWESSFACSDEAPTKGLAAYWSFDNSPNDVQHSEPPTVFEADAAAFDSGILGQAAALEGLAYLNAGDRFNLKAADAFSFTAWVKPNTNTGRFSIISRMVTAEKLFRGYTLQIVNGLPAMFLIHTFPDDMMQVQGKTPLEVDQWNHLAVTYDGSGKAAGVQLYLNGEPQKPGIVIDKLANPMTTDRPFWIGNGHPGAKFKGRIDEVRVYNRVLSADEIKKLPGLSINSLLAIDDTKRNDEQAKRVRRYYLSNHAPPEWRAPFESFEKLKQQVVRREKSIPTVMIMKEAEKPAQLTC